MIWKSDILIHQLIFFLSDIYWLLLIDCHVIGWQYLPADKLVGLQIFCCVWKDTVAQITCFSPYFDGISEFKPVLQLDTDILIMWRKHSLNFIQQSFYSKRVKDQCLLKYTLSHRFEKPVAGVLSSAPAKGDDTFAKTSSHDCLFVKLLAQMPCKVVFRERTIS